MNIAFLSFYSGNVNRGVETYVHELANNLTLAGNQVTVYQGGDKSSGSLYKTSKLLSKSQLPKFDTVPDILIPTNGRLQSIKSSVWAKHNHKKVIISGQSGPGFDDRINLFTFPDCFIALTKHQEKWAKAANPLVNTKVIPNGVDTYKFNPSNKPVSINLKPPVVLTVAALTKEKRINLVIDAIALIPEASLLIVGDGPERGSLMEYAAKKIPGRYEFMKFTFNQMPQVYTACNLFCFTTSPFESFGIVLLEAMASGLGVVTTPDPIRKEIVGDSGIVSVSDKPEDIASSIKSALTQSWSKLNVDYVKKYSWKKVSDSYLELFKSI